MKKLIVYKDGSQFYMDGVTIGLHGGVIDKEIDLTHATDEEKKSIEENPHDDALIAKIKARG